MLSLGLRSIRSSCRSQLSLTSRLYTTGSVPVVNELKQYSNNPKLHEFVNRMRTLCKPDTIHIVDGSEKEQQHLIQLMLKGGVIQPVKGRPNSYYARTDVNDVARAETRTFICSETKEEAGPTNNWVPPKEMREELHGLFDGTMKGRTMYVIPFSMGPIGARQSKIGIEITDSPFVVANMRIMTRVGKQVLQQLGDKPDAEWVPCVHTVGAPLKPGQKDVPWPCNPEKYIVHFPATTEIWSFGSGYGGNSLLGKKCFALRIASVMGRRQGWLAEHMLILGITNPEGKKKYIAAAFPSACGKTNLAMLTPTIPGWKVECVGDDIAWMTVNPKTGQLHAINPEYGFFGVAPGTSELTNNNALQCISKNTIFTNVALTKDGEVWWEGLTKTPPAGLISWKGLPWPKSVVDPKKDPAAHANSRFTAPITQCPIVSPEFENPEGVPISAIIFGGRRPNLVPLVMQAFDWNHGVFLGSSISSARTAAASDGVVQIGEVTHDPFAMSPFCGYNMGDYFQHWLNMGEKASKATKFFNVNWFRQDDKLNYIWPGYGENSRVLKWIFDRCDRPDSDLTGAVKTSIGIMPHEDALDLTGLSPKPDMKQLLEVNNSEWKKEVDEMRAYYEKKFSNKVPEELFKQLNSLEKRLL